MQRETLVAELLASRRQRPRITTLQNVVMPEAFGQQMKFIADTGRGAHNLAQLVKPTNYAAEREKWLETADFNPVFHYDEARLKEVVARIDDAQNLIQWDYPELKDPMRSLFVNLLANRARDLCATGEMAEAILKRESHWGNQIQIEKYGRLDEDLVMEAAAMADELIEETEAMNAEPVDAYLSVAEQETLKLMQFDAQAIKFWLEWSLEGYGFEVPVEITDAASSVTVEDDPFTGITVLVPEVYERKMLDGVEILALNLREIECHVRDSMNARALLRPFGLKQGIWRISDDTLLEGHAALCEAQFHEKYFGKAKLPAPWSVMAMDLAAHDRCSFLEVAERIRSWLEDCLDREAPAKAWDYAYGVFCGSRSTFAPRYGEEPFVCLKDKAYLEGYLMAKALTEAGLGHWLEIGGLRPNELIEIAQAVEFLPEDVPYPNKDTTHAMCALFLADAQ